MTSDEEIPLTNVSTDSIPEISGAADNNHNDKTVLTWSHIYLQCQQRSSCCQLLGRKKPETPRLLLNDMSGIARPGKILAIMGTSGVGKTTLLKVLSGQDDPQTTEIMGDVMLDGRVTTRTERLSGSAIGYVEQNELFVETMSLEEHLIFQVSFDLYSYVHIL